MLGSEKRWGERFYVPRYYSCHDITADGDVPSSSSPGGSQMTTL